MIDIVILWVNPEDENWKTEYEKYSKLENRKTEGSIRYRDYETLKYLFRGIEKNAPWVNKVHLILAYQSQIPEWLDANCDKLEIHYHKEFIPIDLLPTFNSNCIEMYLHNIKSLADHYILFNDDQFIIDYVPENYFVEDSKCVYQLEEKKVMFDLQLGNTFKATLDNNLMFEINYSTENNLPIKKFKHRHLPEIHSKSLETEIFKDKEVFFLMSFIESRFRHRKNFTNWMFSDIIKLKNDCINKRIYDRSKYIKISDDFESLRDCQLVCINDDSNCDFEDRTKKLREFLEGIYKNKSSFEK